MYVCCSSSRRLGRSIKRENFFYFHAAKINEFLLRNNRGFESIHKTFLVKHHFINQSIRQYWEHSPFKNTVVMPCDLSLSRANLYGSSVGWLENKRMSMQPICYLYWKESQNSINNIAWVKVGPKLIELDTANGRNRQ